MLNKKKSMGVESAIAVNCKEILDNIPSGVYLTDLKRKIIYWNRAAESITGYMKDEVIGAHCFDNLLTHMDQTGQNLCRGLCPLAKTISDGTAREGDVFLHHKDGHRKSVRISTMALKDSSGAIIGAAEFFSDISEFGVAESKIRELEKIAFFDQLCQLPNRGHIESELELTFHELKRYRQNFGVLFLDIDHFKKFNDDYGHQAGDGILKTVAATLRSSSRPFDMFGRWGGEEFVGIIKNVDQEKLESIAHRYRKLIEQSSIRFGNKPLGITVSIGATIAEADDSIISVIHRADQLMYECKKKGRNCVAFG